MLVACDSHASDSNPRSVTFDGDKQLILVAQYTVTAQSNSIVAWADVPIGTTATVDMTGPLHMHCEGTFQPPIAGGMSPYGGRPSFALDAFAAPAGRYAVVVSIPSQKVELNTTFLAGTSYRDPITNVWDLPRGCVQVADSRPQLAQLTAARTRAVQIYIRQVDAADLKSKLEPLADAAVQAVLADNKEAAIEALTAIQVMVQPLTQRNPYFAISRDATDALALLAQPVPAEA